MSYEGPSICEYCQRDQHCYSKSDTSICHCACPAYVHLSRLNQGIACGIPVDAAASMTNDWICVTCPDCLLARPSDVHYAALDLGLNFYAACGVERPSWKQRRNTVFQETRAWSLVTCPGCLAHRPVDA